MDTKYLELSRSNKRSFAFRVWRIILEGGSYSGEDDFKGLKIEVLRWPVFLSFQIRKSMLVLWFET